MRALQTQCENLPELMVIDSVKNKLFSQADHDRGKKMSMSGSDVLHAETQRKVREYEFGHKSYQNKVCAVTRHLGAKQRPSLVTLADFDNFTDKWMKSLLTRITKYQDEKADGGLIEYLNAFDYPASHKAWSHSKISMYERNMHRFFFDPKYKRYLTAFVAMVKSGEVYQSTEFEFDDLGCIIGTTSRPRLIHNPTVDSFGPMHFLQIPIF
jgi:hypothetical protein